MRAAIHTFQVVSERCLKTDNPSPFQARTGAGVDAYHSLSSIPPWCCPVKSLVQARGRSLPQHLSDLAPPLIGRLLHRMLLPVLYVRRPPRPDVAGQEDPPAHVPLLLDVEILVAQQRDSPNCLQVSGVGREVHRLVYCYGMLSGPSEDPPEKRAPQHCHAVQEVLSYHRLSLS